MNESGPDDLMRGVEALVSNGACSAAIEDELARLYGQAAA